jgi:hypothetical protein
VPQQSSADAAAVSTKVMRSSGASGSGRSMSSSLTQACDGHLGNSSTYDFPIQAIVAWSCRSPRLAPPLSVAQGVPLASTALDARQTCRHALGSGSRKRRLALRFWVPDLRRSSHLDERHTRRSTSSVDRPGAHRRLLAKNVLLAPGYVGSALAVAAASNVTGRAPVAERAP